ncbi:tRNA (adenosine(37)-N6)-threonylcarbamoyltransferase complex dimerization subunit type 1 TsaB [Lactococcus insecticola]|uniref:tRNA (Adenosine(37)-N6)-threonylcarbamoyltransferase complex dimerization subunit type 1 TsaB n=1 Tax=Pseudolactococcus insecticola TaxID=2709158 RepID=A0A6A0B8B0_9LACT|nr:tRNA (adenosine(37)-N6)-threonylcarbamoyltransferase complex dimerization subunit type 1 TsaB [Lactococcus insecticola]GFH40671.1 tRNA (adenosine(37)-N6)-threonylcarbamoyltransferase complex dimerization subunit type 1 TsaB [Lactococcus insecticola]
MKILAFDTSSQALSVALTDGADLLGKIDLNIKKNHSITLMPAIDFLMKNAGLVPAQLDRIAVAQGPGSYTGLRIAVTTAKTLASTLNIELVGVSSLAAIAANVEAAGKVVPIIDARRMNVYAGVYENGVNTAKDCHTAFETLMLTLKDAPQVLFTGEIDNFRDLIATELPQAKVLENPERRLPNAYQIAILGEKLAPVDIDNFVPEYLKKVEAEEKWLETHDEAADTRYIQKI